MTTDVLEKSISDYLAFNPKVERHLGIAWKNALKITGCIECARIDLVQRLRFIATKETWATVEQEAEKSNSFISKIICTNCQIPSSPAAAAIRFFKPGTDELL